VSVQVIKVDMERRQVDLGLTEILDRVRESERNRGPRVSRAAGPRSARRGPPAQAVAKGRKTTKAERRRAQRPGRKERAARRKR
jgi:hypothetical protein